jgi:hypothetical protein
VLVDVVTVAIVMGLLPLAFLGFLRVRGQRRDAAWVWLAGAFAVSWIADVIAGYLPVPDRWVVSLVYPVTQTSLVAAVLLPRRRAIILTVVLAVTGCIAALWHGVEGPDIVLRTVAWLAIIGILADRSELPLRLSWALFVYFGLGWIAWLVHAELLVVPSWYAYQSVRLVGLLLFCWAAMKPGPDLKLSRT